MGDRWTPDEDALLREYYPRHGPKWEGWEMLLPRRSHSSIAGRACKIGVRMRDPSSTLVHDSLDGIEGRAASAVSALDDHTRLRLMLMFMRSSTPRPKPGA